MKQLHWQAETYRWGYAMLLVMKASHEVFSACPCICLTRHELHNENKRQSHGLVSDMIFGCPKQCRVALPLR